MYQATFSPDGKRIGYVSWELSPGNKLPVVGYAKVLDTESGAVIQRFETDGHPASGIDFTPDGKAIITGTWGFRVKRHDIESGKIDWDYDISNVGYYTAIQSVDLRTDGKFVVLGGKDNCIRLLDAASGSLVYQIDPWQGHREWVYGLATHPSEPYAVTASYDRSVRVRDLRNGRNVLTMFGYESELYTVSIASGGKRLVITDVAGVVHVVDIDAMNNSHHSENQNNGAGMKSEFLGLRTVKYHVPDIEKGKKWYADILGIQPYFDEPFYVGFNVGGYELGLDPDMSGVKPGNNSMAYWGVKDIEKTMERLLKLGAVKEADVLDVGGGIKVASVVDPFGNSIGIIENPTFVVE